MSTLDWNDKAWGAQADCRAQNHSIDSRAICQKCLAATLAAAYQQGREDNVELLRAAFDAGFWAWPNANEPNRIALRESWIAKLRPAGTEKASNG